ncbi:MAG: diacylglycerol kinase, partial [Litorivicinaceae bacterium]
MGKPGYTGITRVVKAAGYSMRGFIAAWRYESAFRQELALAALMLPVAFWVGRTAVEVILLMSCILLVL